MFGNDIFTRVKRSENKKMAEIAQFLHENDLSVDTTVEVFITVTRDEKLIACGGIAGNIIKCVAISESVRGEGLALTLATELINLAYERHSTHLFIYTKTEYEALFRQCGFSTLTSVPGVMVLMENSATRLKRYAESLKKFRHPGNKIGCIVMNANPFTNGHRYLIQQAAAQCDWLHLFLVKEDSSRFPYEDRLDLVLKGTADIPRLTVHRGSEYIISRATFPCYFIKEQSVINHCLGITRAVEIAHASERLIGIALGAEDYVRNLRTERSPEGTELLFARCSILQAARSAGIQAFDTVYSDANNEAGFLQEAAHIKQLGFDGKSLINPRQIDLLHNLYAPTQKEVDHARRVVEAAEAAAREGLGVVSLNGKMVDGPVIDRARLVLSRAELSGIREE